MIARLSAAPYTNVTVLQERYTHRYTRQAGGSAEWVLACRDVTPEAAGSAMKQGGDLRSGTIGCQVSEPNDRVP